MLIIIYFYVLKIMPIIKSAGIEAVNGIGPIIIILIGISIMFGFAAARRLATTIANGVFDVITVCVRAFFRAVVAFLGWLFRLIPNTFTRVRAFWNDRGASSAFSTIMAVIATIVVVAVII